MAVLREAVRDLFATGCAGSTTLGSILDTVTGLVGQDVRAEHKATVTGLVKDEHARRRRAAA